MTNDISFRCSKINKETISLAIMLQKVLKMLNSTNAPPMNHAFQMKLAGNINHKLIQKGKLKNKLSHIIVTLAKNKPPRERGN